MGRWKRSITMTVRLSVTGYLPFLLTATAVARGGVIFVDADAPPGGNGSSWARAFDKLQDALAIAQAGDELWVAEGRYTPAPPDGDREATFRLVSQTALYGGFDGSEIEREQRVPELHETVLSGDLNGNDRAGFRNYDENAYHVVTAIGTADGTVLDGFTISGGFADGEFNQPNGIAAGVQLERATLAVKACQIERNSARGFGGGICIRLDSKASIRACTFTDNASTLGGGGGVHASDSEAAITECLFELNTAGDRGGAGAYVFNRAIVSFDGCRFVENSGERALGGGLHTSVNGTAITACVFRRNTSLLGGGVYTAGRITVDDCEFEANEAVEGGGIYSLASAEVKGCNFSGNRALSGGGLSSIDALLTVDGCEFSGNAGTDQGGGLASFGHRMETAISNCRFEGNSAGFGGGAYLNEATGPIVGCRFGKNRAEKGGGIYVVDESDSSLTNSLFYANEADTEGGAMYVRRSDPRLVNCTLTGNSAAASGGGIFNSEFGARPSIVNTVLWFNFDVGGMDESAQIHNNGILIPIVSYSCVQGWTGQMGGTGNIGDDPVLTDPTNHDYRPACASPCIDAGDSTVVGPQVDLDGNPRLVDAPYTPNTGRGDPPVDMGAYEFGNFDSCCSGALFSSDTVPHGGIDARELHAFGDPDDLTGLTELEFSFDDSKSVVGACFHAEETGGETPPEIRRAARLEGNRLRIRLSRPITAGEWTTIAYGDHSLVDVGFLPGDVNQSGASTGKDIADLVDCLSGEQSCASYQTDLNRDGVSRGPGLGQPSDDSDATVLTDDIRRLLDILSSSPGDPRVWLNVSLPPQPNP